MNFQYKKQSMRCKLHQRRAVLFITCHILHAVL